jgi:hypothetical protein
LSRDSIGRARTWARPSLALVAALAVCIPAANASAASKKVTCELKRDDRVKCPRGKLRGPRGPAGPAGPHAPSVPIPGLTQQFTFLAASGTPTTTFATFEGAVVEAGCDLGANVAGLRVRFIADNNAIQLTHLETGTALGDRDADAGESVTVEPPVGSWQLNYLSGSGRASSASFSVEDGGGVGGSSDCAIYGTLVPG